MHAERPANLDLEVLPPEGIKTFRKGDSIEMELELITLPRASDDYYGPNNRFREHLATHPNSWKTTHREALGNRLEVKVAGGTLLERYPVVVLAEKDEVSIEVKGGVGAIPLTVTGLPTADSGQLFPMDRNNRVPIDQAVHGNDFWQTDYDSATKTYSMTFNLPSEGNGTAGWIFATTE